ncbi:MAG: glycine cleavage T C-terminal barrel domain-containing protein [Vicinamibacterales bacterium]
MIPAVSTDAYAAARHRAAFIDRSARGRIVVSGKDRASYLQGLLTNDIVALKAGQGCYAAYLTPQGRMIADLLVYEVGDVILLTMSGDVKDTVLGKLDQFIFSEDVQLGDVTGSFAQMAVIGPHAAAAVAGALSEGSADMLSGLGEHGNLRALIGGQPAIVARITDTGEPGFDVFLDRSQVAGFTSALERAGVLAIDATTAEAIRIEAGVPLFHRDMDEETIPLEAGIESRAISLTKGCYVGQEVIIRVLHRGHGRVARKLVGLTLDGDQAVAAGAAIRTGDREIGHVTSSTLSPALGRPIALAYVQRDFVEPGTAVLVDGASAVVASLPFVQGH